MYRLRSKQMCEMYGRSLTPCPWGGAYWCHAKGRMKKRQLQHIGMLGTNDLPHVQGQPLEILGN